MNFTSGIFLIFLLICIIVYYCIPKKGQYLWLLLCGMFFYAFAGAKLCVFIGFSIVTSYVGARYMEKVRWNNVTGQMKDRSALLLAGCIVSNAGLLFLLKFAASGSFLAARIHLDRFAFLIPMGISFYTLQIIAYLVDVYKGKSKAEKNFLHYMLFVTYFPHILQGPIPRYEQLGRQLKAEHYFDYYSFVGGFELMLWGFFQKLVIADRANIIVNRLFGEYQNYPGMYMILAGCLYSIQLYTDFNGCVCIARGVSEMLGISLAENFDHPYFADSVQDFWHRWHMSLSSWLKDYIYIPLGGNRKGKKRKYINILLTFLVSGLWHGIGLHYIVWGMLHGLYQVMGQILTPVRDKIVMAFKVNRSSFSHRLLKQCCTFVLVMLAWVFFRASSTGQAIRMIKSMFTCFNPWILWNQSIYLLGLDAKNVWILIFSILVLWIVSFLQTRFSVREKLSEQGIVFRYIIVYIAVFAILIFGIYGPGYDSAQFIYGNF